MNVIKSESVLQIYNDNDNNNNNSDNNSFANDTLSLDNINFEKLTVEQIAEFEKYINQIVNVNGQEYKVTIYDDSLCLEEICANEDLNGNGGRNDNRSNKNNNNQVSNVGRKSLSHKNSLLVDSIMENPQQFDNCLISMNRKEYLVNINSDGDVLLQEYSNYVCSDCSKLCNTANALKKHYMEVHKEKVYVCRSCPKVFQELTDLFLHARRDHVDPTKPEKNPGDFRFHCSFPGCTYMTNNGGTFEHHRRAHTKEKPFKCQFCDKRFSQKTNRNTHQTRHNNEKKFECEICKKQFKTYDIYLSHLASREHELREHSENLVDSIIKIVCIGCNTKMDKLFDIKNHLKVCNLNLESNYQCLECKVMLTDFDDLKHHLKTHKDNMLIQCPVCGARGFDHMNKLNHHITRTHMIKVTRKEVCRYCENTFSTSTELKMHVKEYHKSEINSRNSRGAIGRYLCDYENCKFTANTEMHMRSHISRHERGLIDALTIKSEPMKRERKRKLPNVENNNEEHSVVENLNVIKKEPEVESCHETQTKRKRGRPKKET